MHIVLLTSCILIIQYILLRQPSKLWGTVLPIFLFMALIVHCVNVAFYNPGETLKIILLSIVFYAFFITMCKEVRTQYKEERKKATAS
ncbi:hypothetical protein [Savagea faecisuis]|uniref:Uncharacterized protein n=1 Tax=Savagea faecisuis TaxID=1274803 RepID=A0ABW3GVG1_9BACL